MAMKNTQIDTKKKVQVVTLIALAIAAVALSACNTVRGVARDVEGAANALDPEK